MVSYKKGGGAWKVIAFIILTIVLIGILLLLYSVWNYNRQQVETNTEQIQQLQTQIEQLQQNQNQPKKSSALTWLILIIILITAVSLIIIYYKKKGLTNKNRQKIETMLYEQAKKEPGNWLTINDHKIESEIGYYGAKPSMKQIVITFTTTPKTKHAPTQTNPPKHTLLTYTTSFKNPEEDIIGPKKITSNEMMELLRLSQHGHKGGGIPREAVKTESILPPHVQEHIEKKMAGELLDI